MERGERTDSYRWVILAIVYFSILAFALIFQTIPPILPFIISELQLNYAQSGLLMSLFALPGLFISLLGGFLSDRYGMKPLGAGCFLLMIIGTLLLALGKDIHILWLGRIIAGTGAFTLSVFLPKLISQWFKGREVGFAMGVYNTGVPLGSVICFSLFGKIGSLWGWRMPVLLTGIYLFLTSILFLTLYQVPSHREPENLIPSGMIKSLKKMGRPIWWVAFSWLWFNAGFISFATFAPDLFLGHGYTIEGSGLLIGVPLLGSLFLSAPTGYLVDRLGRQEWLIGIGGIALSILTLFFNFSSSFLVLVVLMGVFSALIPSPIYSLPPEILEEENVGLGYGVISTCSSIGLFIAPYLVGKARDLTGSYHLSFILISLFFFLITVSTLFTYRSRGSAERFLKKFRNL